jgi:hypothetical protein
MDDKTIDLLARAINEGVTSTSWAILALAAVTAGATAFMGAYLAKRGNTARSARTSGKPWIR